VYSCCASYHLKTQNYYTQSINGCKENYIDIFKIGNLKKKKGIIKIPKQDEDIGYLQILLQLTFKIHQSHAFRMF